MLKERKEESKLFYKNKNKMQWVHWKMSWLVQRQGNSYRTLTSCSVGAFILIFRQRERTASVTLEELLQHKIRRQDALCFSMVLRRECWASLESLSTSFSTRTDIATYSSVQYMCHVNRLIFIKHFLIVLQER